MDRYKQVTYSRRNRNSSPPPSAAPPQPPSFLTPSHEKTTNTRPSETLGRQTDDGNYQQISARGLALMEQTAKPPNKPSPSTIYFPPQRATCLNTSDIKIIDIPSDAEEEKGNATKEEEEKGNATKEEEEEEEEEERIKALEEMYRQE